MIIRKANIQDSNNILKMLLALDTETKNMLLEPGERSTDTSRIESTINNSINGSNLFLVVEKDNNIVGFLSAERGTLNRIKHSAYIVVGIRKDYQGQGIGSKLFLELDHFAKENSISRLELTVICTNTMAKHLYEKNGFQVEGVKKNSMVIDGQYVDEFYMAKLYQ